MRVFVLSTGRSGTTTFAKACGHIRNYTSAHESRSAEIEDRLVYPDGHIEVDNRLAWFLGSLEAAYGDAPLYVWLTREPEEVAESYAERFRGKASLVRAFGQGILQRTDPPEDEETRLAVSRLCVATINANIKAFLRGKPRVVVGSLPDLRPAFDEMCRRIGADVDLPAAHHDLGIRYNRRRKRGHAVG